MCITLDGYYLKYDNYWNIVYSPEDILPHDVIWLIDVKREKKPLSLLLSGEGNKFQMANFGLRIACKKDIAFKLGPYS